MRAKTRNIIIGIASVAAVTGGILLTSSNQHNYYFSSQGDDNNSGSINSPFKSLNKLNSVLSNASEGDSFLLNKGDVFYGNINVNKNGISITAYGEGDAPLLSGFTSVTNWTSLGNNLYESNTISNGLSDLNLVTVDGVPVGMGRYPNLNEVNAGYFTIDSYYGVRSITDGSLNSSPNWTGAELVIRSERWVLDRKKITNHSGHTISYSNGETVPKLGYGYFIQNSIKTLDKNHEWYWNASTKKLTMYSSNGQPQNVKVSTKQNIITTAKSDLKLFNLTTEGANDISISFTSGVRNTLQNVTVSNSGGTGIYVYNSVDANLQKIKVLNCLNKGIDLAYGSKHTLLKSYEIRNTHMIAGMGGSGQGQGIALNVRGTGTTIESGKIINSGFIGIFLGNADSITIKNFVIDSFCSIKDDGGGFYAWSPGTTKIYNKARVLSNGIIMHGIGAIAGQPTQTGLFANSAFGLYFDINSSDIVVKDNFIKEAGRAAIYLHYLANNLTFTNNTLFNTQYLFFAVRNGTKDIYANTVKNNVFFTIGNQLHVKFDNYENQARPSIGTMDNNYFVNYSNKLTPFSSKTTNYSLSSWQSSLGFDRSSSQILITDQDILKPVNAEEETKVIDLEDYQWRDAKGFLYNDLTLNPYEAGVLIRGAKIIVPPVDTIPTDTIPKPTIVISSNLTYTAPANITLNAVVTGKIVKVDFRFNDKPLYTDRDIPWRSLWSGVPRGTYKITAKATDSTGNVGISNSLLITVQ